MLRLPSSIDCGVRVMGIEFGKLKLQFGYRLGEE